MFSCPTGPAGEVLFLVGDVDAEAERLRGLGIEFLSGPGDRPWGNRTLHLLDPDGLVVELAQKIPGSCLAMADRSVPKHPSVVVTGSAVFDT